MLSTSQFCGIQPLTIMNTEKFKVFIEALEALKTKERDNGK
jgi:hypothetical protein